MTPLPRVWRGKRGGKKAGIFPILIVLATVFISACVGQDGGDVLKNVLTLDVIRGGAEDLTVQAKVPEFARANRNFSWQLVAQPVPTVRDFSIKVADRCVFQNMGKESFSEAEIRGNNTKIFTLKYHTPEVEFERACPVLFMADYRSDFKMSTTVAVLDDVEYMQRKAAGKLGEIEVSTWSSRSPLQITVSWGPEGQPFLSDSRNQMYINYRNTGSGTIAKMEREKVVIKVPSNMGGSFICDDYGFDAEKRELVLSKDLDFVRKEAKKSTCTFTAKAGQPIDSQGLVLSAEYRYQVEGTVEIPLLAK